MGGLHENVLDGTDLVGLVLVHVPLDPRTFVRVGTVSKAWHDVCRSNAHLLMAAARGPRYLTKTVFSGLFGLSSKEADAFPRDEVMHSRVRTYMYTATATDAVLQSIGGLTGWRARLARRARQQASLEQAFGPDWRELRFIASEGGEAKRWRRRLV